MILALNFYYANNGQEDAVRRQRLLASDVRVKLGIPRGQVLWLAQGTPELPTVIWACPFVDAKAHEADMWTRHFSPEFEQVRAGMRQLTHRFERVLYKVEDGVAEAMLAPWVWQCWWTVPAQYQQMLLDSLLETARGAREEGTRGDAVLSREEGSKSLPWVICAAAFPDRARAFGAFSESTADDGSSPPNPLKPAYSLWERLD